MIETQHPAPPTHLPWFITKPGQTDWLMVSMGIFLIFFTAIMLVLILRLSILPAQIVPQEQKAKYEVVATLCLLDIFVPGFFLWIAALLLAITDIPDFTLPFRRTADAVRHIAQSRKME